MIIMTDRQIDPYIWPVAGHLSENPWANILTREEYQEMTFLSKLYKSVDRASFAHVFLSVGSEGIGRVAETVECRVSGLKVEFGREIPPVLQQTIL